MNYVKNEEAFLDGIQEAIATYSYDNNDKNFEATVKVSVRRGLTKASIIKEHRAMDMYVVLKTEGQYEDTYTCPFKIFSSLEKAEAFAKEQNEYYNNLDKKYQEFGYNGSSIYNKLFDKYLETTNKELYDKTKNLNEEHNVNWEDYYDLLNDFIDNKELIEKYSNICELSDKEKETIEVYEQWNRIQDCGTMPYFHVNMQSLTLVQ